MHLWSIKKQTGDKVSRRDFLFNLAAELPENYIVERSSRNTAIDRLHPLSTAPNKTKVEKRKKCQIAANCTQNKTSKSCFKCKKMVYGKGTNSELPEFVMCATTQI